MSADLDTYPPNPVDVPPDLTVPTRGYRAQVVIVLASLFLFLVLYLGLVGGSAWVSYRCFAEIGSGGSTRHMSPAIRRGRRSSPEDNSVAMLAIVGIASGVLCLFLVKGFFKRSPEDKSLKIELKEQEHPQLFAFIRRLCRDTRAPFPHRVYVTPEVNAAVFYHESILNLVLPARKNLIIGLGLVNVLSLTEFKAVLAHEFGHFSQNSMKLGRYVYVSNRIIGDLVFGRDWLDDLMIALRSIDIRIAIFVWLFTGVLWVVRKLLQGLFRLINFANSALSRQMEFSADLVAVSVTGSDALVNGLSRLDFASEALGQAWTDLQIAADHELYTTDLYFHQTRAAEYLRVVRKDPRLGKPPPASKDPNKTTQVFQPEDTSVPKMWATHPSNFDREENAKRRYVPAVRDNRNPWILFRNVAALRKAMSWQLYQENLGVVEVTTSKPEEVQAFIDAEHAETTYDPRYEGMYDDRYIKPGELEGIGPLARKEFADAKQLAAAHAALLDVDLPKRMKAHRDRQEEHILLLRLTHGAVELRGKDFSFRGTRRPAADAKRLSEQVEKELDQDYESLSGQDRKSLLVHCEMARQVDKALQSERVERYRFHVAIQNIHAMLGHYFSQAQEVTQALAGNRNLSQEDFAAVRGVLQQLHSALSESLHEAGQLTLPQFKNFSITETLPRFLLNRPLTSPLSDNVGSLDGKWIGGLFEQVGEVIERVKRLHFKSLGGILALQEQIAERWIAAQQTASVESAAESSAPESS